MVSERVRKILLCTAGTLAILQSAVNLIGGISTAFDTNPRAFGYWVDYFVGDYNYHCGFMSITNPPPNVGDGGSECMENNYQVDRGWFKRVRDYCSVMYGYEYSRACSLHGFSYVIAFAVVTGVSWTTAGILLIISAIKRKKKLTIAALVFLGVGYAAAITTFGIVWDSVLRVNRRCLVHVCRQVEKRGQKSSKEFLAYAVSSFVSIFVAGVLAFVGYCSFKASYSEGERGEPSGVPPAAGPGIYLVPISAAPDGVPYGMPVNAQPVLVPAQVCSLKGHATDCPGKSQASQSAGSHQKSAFGVDGSLKEVSSKLRNLPASKEQHMDIMAILKKFAGLLGIVEINKSINNNAKKGKKFIFGNIASQSINSPIIKRLLGMAGVIEKVSKEGNIIGQGEEGVREMKGELK